jgi:hypothetical protein
MLSLVPRKSRIFAVHFIKVDVLSSACWLIIEAGFHCMLNYSMIMAQGADCLSLPLKAISESFANSYKKHSH